VLLTLESLAVVFLKQWAVNKKSAKITLVVGVSLYAILAIVLAYILKMFPSEMVVINTLWQTINIIVITLIGVIVYKEPISKIQKLGIILAVVASLCFL
jgi:multidrug transporter EmrE-like cation transporter